MPFRRDIMQEELFGFSCLLDFGIARINGGGAENLIFRLCETTSCPLFLYHCVASIYAVSMPF